MYGTNDLLSLLIAQQGFLTIAEYGEDKLFAQARQSLEIHNELVAEMQGNLLTPTTRTQVRWGGSGDEGEMHPVDEYGRPDAEMMEIPFATNGLPLNRFMRSVQWTWDYMQMRTVEEFALQLQGIERADRRNVIRQIRRALYTSTNSLNYVDRLYRGEQYAVRALLNGDGTPIPPNEEDGTAFPANHTHYIADAGGVTTAGMDALVSLILEHTPRGTIVIEIAQAQEVAVRGLPGFVEFTDPRLMQPNTITPGDAVAVGGNRLQIYNPRNRQIGLYGAAEVWVKPYAIAGYIVARDTGRFPLAWRTRPTMRQANGATRTFGALEVAAEDERFPLRARTVRREFGIGVNDRSAAAVLYVGGGAYVIPAIP